MMGRRALATFGVAVLVLACGGDSDSDTTPSDSGGTTGGGSGGTESGGAGGGSAGETAGAGGDTPSGGSAGTGGAGAAAGTGGAGAAAGTGGAGAAAGTGGAGAAAGTGGEATGGVSGGAGEHAGGAGGVPACCGVDAECPPGYSCAGTRDDLGSNLGMCEPTPTDGTCYNDIDCPDDGLCYLAVTCACNVQCLAPNEPGTCQPMGEPCCHVDEDCRGGQICVGAGVFTKGRCAPPPTGSECYTDQDCATGTCEGASTCQCGVNCPTMAGTCVAG